MKINVRRIAGEPLTPEQRQELEVLAKMPDEQIDFSDIPERPTGSAVMNGQKLVLEEHTVTVHIDAEVAAWLKASAKEDAEHINRMLKHLARRKPPRRESPSIQRAS
jgi:uncharacterized protein (DUF4415 family)